MCGNEIYCVSKNDTHRFIENSSKMTFIEKKDIQKYYWYFKELGNKISR
jgi:hypothetical protein